MSVKKSKYCSLVQAVNWIAYGCFDRDENFSYENKDELAVAADKLKYSICRHKIRVFKVLPGGKDLHEITNLDVSMLMNVNLGCIGHLNQMYLHVLVPVKDVIKNYPATCKPLKTRFYTTPYLDIMQQVIQEEHITTKNQPKIEALYPVIANKMRIYKLPKSDRLAKAMATMIRLPGSQKGRSPKG